MKKQIKCIVACVNSNGDPDLYFTIVECTQNQIDTGVHYDRARGQCEEDGYEAYLVYDEECDAGKSMLPLFVWESANILGI